MVLPPPATFLAPLRDCERRQFTTFRVYDFSCATASVFEPVLRHYQHLRTCPAPLRVIYAFVMRHCLCSTRSLSCATMRDFSTLLWTLITQRHLGQSLRGTLAHGLTVSQMEDVVNCPKPCLKADRCMTILLILYFSAHGPSV